MSIIVDNITPISETKFVSPAFVMTAGVHDDSGAPIDLGTIDMLFNDGYVIYSVMSGGIPQPNFNVIATPSRRYGSDGYDFTISSARLFKDKGMTLSIYVNGTITGGIPGPHVDATAARGLQLWTANPTKTAAEWRTATPPGMTNWPYGMDISDDGRCIITTAIGSSSQVIISTDYGATWTITVPVTGAYWTDACCSASGQFMAVCSSGLSGPVKLLISSNYGATWTDRTSAASSYGWNAIDMNDDGYCLVLANRTYNTTYCQVSTNGGATWSNKSFGGGCGGYTNGCAISGDGATVLINAQYKVWRSANYGNSWATYTLPTGYMPDRAISTNRNGTYMCAGGNDGKFYVSTNSGSTWTQPSTPVGMIYGLSMNGDGTHIALGAQNGSIYLSTNTGTNWTNLSPPTNGDWYEVSLAKDIDMISATRYVNGLYVYIYGRAFESWRVGNTTITGNIDFAIGPNLDTTLTNVVTAFNNKVGRNVTASRFQADIIVYAANDAGVSGNSIPMTESLDTEGDFWFNGSYLSGGTDETTQTTGYVFYTASHYGRFAPITPPIPATGVAASFTQSNVSGTTMSGRKSNIMFQPNAKIEPTITNRIPVKNSTDNFRTTPIQFSLHDSGLTGVDITSLNVWINGEQVIDTAAFIEPWTGTIVDDVIDDFPGYTIHINNHILFPYSSTVSVRVKVKDLIADPMAVNTLDTTYSFRITQYIDNDPPEVDPGQPPTGLDPGACIEFDWLDAPYGDGPDFSTLNVTLRRELTVECITDVRDSVAVVDGVAAPGYTLYATHIQINNQIGYHVIICPDVPFNELETVTVIINGQDLNGNPTESTFSVSTMETTPPAILNLVPYPGQESVESGAIVKFDMHDYGGVGVSVSKLGIKLNNTRIVINGVAQSGYTLLYTKDDITDQFNQTYDGYHFVIGHTAGFFPNSLIEMEIDGYDAYGNYTIENYNFRVAADTTPPTVWIRPDAGETGISRDTLINVFVTDIVGVNANTVNVKIRGLDAIINGTTQSRFNVTRTSWPDGYRYVIDPLFTFDFNESVNVTVSATDISGNTTNKTIAFRTYHDPYAPTISNVTPVNGQREISINTPITFTIRDAYDVAFNSINCTVDGQLALVNGIAYPDFTWHVSRLSDGYSYTIRPKINFQYNRAIAFSLRAEDYWEHNLATLNYTWYTVVPKPPRFSMILPATSSNVAVDTNISFSVLTDGYKVDINTLNVYVDGNAAILNKVFQSPDYTGTVTTISDGYNYTVTIDPRFLLEPNVAHNINISAKDLLSQTNTGTLSFGFNTGAAPANEPTVYIGSSNGVKLITTDNIDGYSLASSYVDGYYVNHIYAKTLKYINRLAISTSSSGTIVKTTNYAMNPMHYSNGHEILKTIIAENNNGTLYLLNTTHNRIDVYYGILYDNSGRNTPDGYYTVDGYITDLVITENTSILDERSNSLFIATDNGVYRIETDETSNPKTYQLYSYGINGSGKTYDIIEGTTNYVVAVDVNPRLNMMYVATRSASVGDQNVITYIDLNNNIATGSVTEDRLLDRLINSVSFKD